MLNVGVVNGEHGACTVELLNTAGQVIARTRGRAGQRRSTVGFRVPSHGVYVVRYVSGPAVETRQVMMVGR
jgi:hypothetical protein